MLASAVAIPAGAFSFESKEQSLAIASLLEKIRENYAEYYSIPRISAEVINVQTEEENTVYTVSVSLARVLLVENAEDLPYIQGLLTAAETLDAESKAIALENIGYRIAELEGEYIGKEQEENGIYQIAVPNVKTMSAARKVSDAVYSVSDHDLLFPVESLRPESLEALREQGRDSIQSYAAEVAQPEFYAETMRERAVLASVAQDYDRIDARNYIRTYCCDSGLRHTCPYRNTNYAYYANDCANYVSQAIYAGGIQQDSVWNTSNIQWFGVGAPYNPELQDSYPGLTTYMMEKGFFFQTIDKYKAFAGSIVYWYGDHVGMVDQNDTVTMTYCAHNRCEKQKPFQSWWVYGFYGDDSTGQGKVSFLVPVWDSYAGTWTPR